MAMAMPRTPDFGGKQVARTHAPSPLSSPIKKKEGKRQPQHRRPAARPRALARGKWVLEAFPPFQCDMCGRSYPSGTEPAFQNVCERCNRTPGADMHYLAKELCGRKK